MMPMTKGATMNHYGALAQRHWQRDRAAEYALIQDPESYFTELGTRISAEIARRRNADRSTEAAQSTDFLANLGALNRSRAPIVDDVLREMAFTQPGSMT
jgi:hypothetical protein